jgi:DNA-binding NarL/FixJ family response regulator
MYSIHIADDHPIFCSAITTVIEQALPGTEVSHSLSLDQLLDHLSAHDVDLLLLDLNMPGSRDLMGLLSVRERYPALPIAVISANSQPGVMRKAIGYGAIAYIPKSCSQDEISQALACVLSGDHWLPAEARGNLEPLSDQEKALADKLAMLTAQQHRVLQLLREGMLNKQIAAELSITEATVKAHLSAIFKALDVRNRTQAVVTLGQLNTE